MKTQFQPHVRMCHYMRVRIRGANRPDDIRGWIVARYGAQTLWRGDDQSIVFQVDIIPDEPKLPEDEFLELAKQVWKLNKRYCPIEVETYLVMHKSVHQFESEPDDAGGSSSEGSPGDRGPLGAVGSIVAGVA